MRDCISAPMAFFLTLVLSIFIPSVFATTECPSRIGNLIKATLDNDKLFSSCAADTTGLKYNVRSLFDVLDFSEQHFLRFCRAPSCIKPVKVLLRSIPTNCLIIYHGSARNLSEEVSTLYHQCTQVISAADKIDEDYVYRYFLDSAKGGKVRIPHFSSYQEETNTPATMNWMTSGRHRALYSQRGRRRQMHFPSQAQRQRVKATSPQQNSQPARERDSTTPWYILPVGDDDESQDIRVLELERKSAMTAVAEKDGQSDPASDCGAMGGMEMSPKRKRSDGCQDVREERKETRCIFTPVKKARKYDQLPERAKTIRGDRPPSSIASGVDLLFFK
ncbi:Hypothetical protein PHPALM_3755 [Phytophthora palmivora]|uniref:Elicitin n=1 Tax=Phytophthora palmivora TaxID=4796 RepID=A0A2P4YLK7_9STRA|nr:Hypothetical protein PHPALM_3755 [Phytophthora palmivora]